MLTTVAVELHFEVFLSISGTLGGRQRNLKLSLALTADAYSGRDPEPLGYTK